MNSAQFSLIDQDEDHSGEVIENNDQIEVEAQNQYHTIDENQILYPFENVSYSMDVEDSYFPEENQQSSTFKGYQDSYYSTSSPPALTTDLIYTDILLPFKEEHVMGGAEINNTMIKLKKNLYAFYYIGYKLWYIPLLFGVYHVTILIVYLLSLLAKHYLHFPSALHAAASSSRKQKIL